MRIKSRRDVCMLRGTVFQGNLSAEDVVIESHQGSSSRHLMPSIKRHSKQQQAGAAWRPVGGAAHG